MADFTMTFGGEEHFLWPSQRKTVKRWSCPCCDSERWDEVIELLPMSEWSPEERQAYEALRERLRSRRGKEGG